jgi:WD40 repeat protein/tetratricopeptide (TPR) repeat protein
MSQKAICPRGHIWDPSTLAGLPPTETPRCPICGEEEPLRASNALARLSRWSHNNPLLATMLVLCLLLIVALTVTMVRARNATRTALEEVEKAEWKAKQIEARLHAAKPHREAEEPQLRQKRQAEVETARLRDAREEFQKQLRKAEKATKEAVEQRNEQANARKVAEDLQKSAEMVRDDALDRRATAAKQLVKMHVADGLRFMDKGDLSTSLLWFAEALRLAHKEKLPEETHRLRLAAVLARCPRPVQVWSHDKKVIAVQLSADGKRVMALCGDQALRVWETASGKPIGESLAHEESVTHAVLSPDGKRALTADADNKLHLWDVDAGKELIEASQLMGPLAGLAFSPDGKRFLLVTDKAPPGTMGPTEVELHVHDAASGAALREQPLGSDLRPLPAAFSPDGQWVLTICRDRCARVWDIATGNQIGASLQHAAPLVYASFSLEGERVLTASSDGTARVWRTRTGEPVTPPLKHGSSSLAGAGFSPSGRHVLTFGVDRAVRVWDASNGEAAGLSLRHPETVSDAVFSPDGRYVLTICDDGAARLWDYRTAEEILPPLRHGEPIRYAAFTPAGDRVLTLSGQVVRLWDVTAGSPLSAVRSPQSGKDQSGVEMEVFSPDGKRSLRVTATSVRVWDTQKNEAIVTLPHRNKLTAAAFSADGQRLLTLTHQLNGDEMEGHVRVWESMTGRLIGDVLAHPRSVLEASLSADGKRVLTACQDGKARLWDVDKSTLVGEPMGHKADLVRALFLPNGKHLLTVDAEGGLRLWDAATAEAVGPIWGHKKPVHDLVFSGDGKRLATASADGTARVWEADTGHEIASTPTQGTAVRHVAFSSDSKHIVTASDDRRVRVWDAGTGKPAGPSWRQGSAVSLAAFSEDGKRLVTVAADGVRIWDAASGQPVAPLLRPPPLPPPTGGDKGGEAIRGVRLARDGQIALHAGGDPSPRWTCFFREDKRSVEELLSLAEVLSGQHVTDAGATAWLSDAAIVTAWGEVRKKHGKELASSPERSAAWDRRGAEECENRRLWIGVVRHLDRLIASSGSADLHARRGRANAELRRWQAARDDYSKALADDGGRWDWLAGRAEAEAALGRWQEALADYSKAIERKGDRAELWTARGRIEAERGDWRKAADDLGKAVHLGEANGTVWCQHALALLASGDEMGYRRLCGRLAKRFGDSKDESVLGRVVTTCTLLDGVLRDWKPLLQNSRLAVKTHPQSADNWRQLAMLLYRAGQFDEAVKSLQRGMELDPNPQARDELLMALAAQRQGRAEDAKKWLDKAEQIQRDRAKDARESWEDHLVYQTLHREAEKLAKGGK